VFLCKFDRPLDGLAPAQGDEETHDAGAASDVKSIVDVFSYRREVQRAVCGHPKRVVLQI
jgi:hypothetical protein